MRLSSKEISVIKSAFRTVFGDFSFSLYLFGSRTDIQKKGGDIDLLLVVPAERKTFAVDKKSAVRLKIFETLAEQRIDITVATSEEIKTDVFLLSIMKSAIEI